MPDLISVISQRWKLIVTLTLIATGTAFLACLLSPKEYLGVVTALPGNSLLSDKARIFNQNIEALYPELGTPDELDKIEGTAKLDTIFLAVANEFNLAAHYKSETTSGDALYNAAAALRKKSNVSRSGYGELKIKVWDKESGMAAALANALQDQLNKIHQQLQTENKQMILHRLKEAYALKQNGLKDSGSAIQETRDVQNFSTSLQRETRNHQLQQYSQLIDEYELSLKASPKALLVVEKARPSPWPDKPKTGQTVLLAFLASLLFSFLLAFFVESRNVKA